MSHEDRSIMELSDAIYVQIHSIICREAENPTVPVPVPPLGAK
jgi:hypothetical protein